MEGIESTKQIQISKDQSARSCPDTVQKSSRIAMWPPTNLACHILLTYSRTYEDSKHPSKAFQIYSQKQCLKSFLWSIKNAFPAWVPVHSSRVCETPLNLWMVKNGNLDPDKTGFFKHHFLLVFEKMDPDNFPTSQIFKISCSCHSKNVHIKLNLDSWCRAERCGPPFIFYGLEVEIRPKWTLRAPHPPTRAVYPPEVGQ